jgi:hypothetical protein
MPLGNKSSRGVDHDTSTVSVIAPVNKFASLAFWAETKCFIRNKFICGKAIVKLNYTNLFWANS